MQSHACLALWRRFQSPGSAWTWFPHQVSRPHTKVSSLPYLLEAKNMLHIQSCPYLQLCLYCRHDRVVGIFITKGGKYRRMDVIMPTYKELPYCLVSWTGKSCFLDLLAHVSPFSPQKSMSSSYSSLCCPVLLSTLIVLLCKLWDCCSHVTWSQGEWEMTRPT